MERRGTLLCIGSYPYDVVHLLAVTRATKARLGLEPVFVSLAPPDAAAQVRDLVAADGFELVDRAFLAPPDRSARNMVVRARQQRLATNRLMDDLLGDLQPAAVLTTVNPPPGLFLDEAAQRGVPTVLLQLFHWGDRAFYRDLQADDRRHTGPPVSARRRVRRELRRRIDGLYGLGPHIPWDLRHATVAVQGPAMRRRVVAEGVPSENVVVTGNPAYDELHRLRGSIDDARARIRRQLGLAEDVRIVTQMRSHEARLPALDRNNREVAQVRILEALTSADPAAQVVVKIHPKEGEAERAFVRSIDPGVITVGEEVDTNDLLAASDVVVGTASTTLLYAAMLDRPTLSIWLWEGVNYFRRSTEWAGVERVERPEALTEAVRRHLDDPETRATWQANRERFVRDEFAFDGESTRRVVDLIERRTRERDAAGIAGRV